MTLEPMRFPPIDDAGRAAIDAALRRYRARQLERMLLAASEPAYLDGLGDHAAAVVPYLERLHAWWSDDRDRFWAHANHWAPTFCLARVASPTAAAEERRLAAENLAALHLFERFERAGSAGDEPVVITTDDRGGVMDLRTCAWYPLPFGARAKVVWRWDRDAVAASPLDGDGAGASELRVAPPLRRGRELAPVLPPRIPALPAAILASAQVLGVEEERTDGEPPPVLTLEQSLSRACEVLAVAWPATLDWLRELVPAFAALGASASSDVRRSQSFGPGCPIFLSLVANALDHAEDLVHEVQHHRFHLWALDRPFESLEDPRRRFVSMYRKDVRPLHGLHLGVHAFASVNELRLRAHDRGIDVARGTVALLATHLSNLFAFGTIVAHERFEPPGRPYLVELAARLAEHHRQIMPRVDAETLERLDGHLRAHAAHVSTQAPAGVLNSSPELFDWDATAALARSIAQGAPS